MSDAARIKHLSKFMALVLRHAPETIAITLDGQGWVEVAQLLDQAALHGCAFTREELMLVVAGSDKQRFALSDDVRRVRANQGHSIAAIDLALRPSVPPPVLYHGTAERYLASIAAAGLLPGSRNHVHLSRDPATGVSVGKRHGRPVLLTIDAAAMQRAGHVFFVSDNGVWLTAAVPLAFIAFP